MCGFRDKYIFTEVEQTGFTVVLGRGKGERENEEGEENGETE